MSEELRYPVKLGILNGFVEDRALEKPPTKEEGYPWTEFNNIEVWKNRFSQIKINGKAKYKVEDISISQISNEFAIIINPFGEAYPEKDLKRKLCFSIIREYIEDGGIIVNVAGFPFFYAWDVINGRRIALSEERLMIPSSVKVELDKLTGEIRKVVMEQYKLSLLFSGSLFWREFEAITTADTPVHAGAFLLEVYQSEEDREVAGDLVSVAGSNKVREFRAPTKDTKNCIPLLRASRPDFGEVYPIAAIPYGLGYLIVGGMNTISEVEFEKLVVGVDNFCSWVAKKAKGKRS